MAAVIETHEQAKQGKGEVSINRKFEEMNPPCRDTSLCRGGTRQVLHRRGYSRMVYSQGSDSNPQHSDRTAGPQFSACSYTKAEKQ